MFGLVKFVKDAGRKIGEASQSGATREELEQEIRDLGLENKDVKVDVKPGGKVSVGGIVMSQEMKEKILLAVGNVDGIEEVEDGIEAKSASANSELHTVAKGDTLWAISKKYYGKGSRYKEIFEANRPMLSHPDKIFVGQVLRIPKDSDNTA